MIVHVAANGNDTSGTGSAQNPYRTIARAASVADPGTAIRVHAGSYPGDEFVEDLTGTAQQPIWIGGAPGEAVPVLDGAGDEGLHISGLSYVVLHDLDVRYMTDNGINIDDRGEYDNPLAAHHLVVKNVSVFGIGGDGNQDCLKLSGVNHVTVVDSDFQLCGGDGAGSGIDMVGVQHALIARNTLEDFDGNAVQAKGGSSDVEIRWNEIHNAGHRALNMGGSTGFTFFRPPLSTSTPNAEARNIRAIANLIVGGNAPFAFVGCVDCLAANNTVINPEQFLVRILQETTSGGGYTFEEVQDGRVINNLFYFSRGDIVGDVNIGPNTQPETFTFSHNLWYAHDAPGQSEPELPVVETGAVIGEDPAFLPGGYRIGAGSPAYTAGTPIAGVHGAMNACYRTPPSIGAYEVP